MTIIATTRKSPETIVRIAHILTRQGAHIEKITITPKEEEQIMEIIIQPHQSISHIVKQITKLQDVADVTLKDTPHDLALN